MHCECCTPTQLVCCRRLVCTGLIHKGWRRLELHGQELDWTRVPGLDMGRLASLQRILTDWLCMLLLLPDMCVPQYNTR